MPAHASVLIFTRMDRSLVTFLESKTTWGNGLATRLSLKEKVNSKLLGEPVVELNIVDIVHLSSWSRSYSYNHIYWVSNVEPASQWYLGGTVFHFLARATIAPASKTPYPKRWLNSSPTPFMVQWNLSFASNREFLFEVRTVKCWMSLQVSCGLETKVLTDYSIKL